MFIAFIVYGFTYIPGKYTCKKRTLHYSLKLSIFQNNKQSYDIEGYEGTYFHANGQQCQVIEEFSSQETYSLFKPFLFSFLCQCKVNYFEC